MLMIMMIMLLLLLFLLFPSFTYSSTISNPTKWILHAKGLASSSSSLSQKLSTTTLKDHRQQNNQQNQQQQQLWFYFGSLFDPLDGRKIANVQGLELIQIIDINNNTNNNSLQLQIIPLLYTNPNATYTDAVTILSQKVFCYTTTTTNSITTDKKKNNDDKNNQNNNEQQILLRELRVRPQSPKKIIPLEQAVSVFETCTTYVSKKKKKQQQQQQHKDMMTMMMMDNNNNDQIDDEEEEEEDELIIHTEFPKSKQTLWGKATNIKQQSSSSSSSSDNSLEYTIFTKRRSPSSILYQPDFTTTTTTSDSKTTEFSSSTQPKRSQLIQIGPSNNNIETKHKFGARETYSWTNINIPSSSSSSSQQQRRRWWWQFLPRQSSNTNNHPSNTNTNTNARLSYTRYGEGPAFYAPGRMCMLELRGKPIQSIDNSTSIIQNLIHNHIDGFDDRSSHRSSSSFSNSSSLRLKPEPISNQPIWQQRKIQLQKLYFKLQKAITVEHNHDSYSSSSSSSNGISQYGVIPR